MRAVVIGCGEMAHFLADRIVHEDAGLLHVVGVAGSPRSAERLRALAGRLSCAYTTDALELAPLTPDLVIEVASAQAVRQYGLAWVQQGVDLVVMSVGALLDEVLLADLTETARRTGCHVYVPSGAIGGLDALRAAREGGLTEVTLISSKPPKALVGAPFFRDHPVDLAALRAPTVIFEGCASDAIRLFPANVNIAALVSLAGIGPRRTRIRVIADPLSERNVHQLVARGGFGELRVELRNVPSGANPKTSLLACLSLVAAIKQRDEPVRVC